MMTREKNECAYCGSKFDEQRAYFENNKRLCSSGCQFSSYAVNQQLISAGDFVVYDHKAETSLISKEHYDCVMLVTGPLGSLRSAYYVTCGTCASKQPSQWHRFTVFDYEVRVLDIQRAPRYATHFHIFEDDDVEEGSSYELFGLDNNHVVAAAINAQIEYDIYKKAMYEPLIKGSTYMVKVPVTSNNLLTYLNGSESE